MKKKKKGELRSPATSGLLYSDAKSGLPEKTLRRATKSKNESFM